VKQLRKKAQSPETFTALRQNPYLEIWDIDYYSTSDEEDNDSGKESESSSQEDSEDDSADQEETKQLSDGTQTKGDPDESEKSATERTEDEGK